MNPYEQVLSWLTLTENPIPKLKAMLGASNFVTLDERGSIQFSIKNRKFNKVVLRVNGGDNIDLELWRITNTQCNKVHDIPDCSGENLKSIFERTTGLRTTL